MCHFCTTQHRTVKGTLEMNISWILIQIYVLLLYHTYGNSFYVNEYSTAILRCPLKANPYTVNWDGPPNLILYSINQRINPRLLQKNRLSVVGSQNNLQISNISETDTGQYRCQGLVINSTASAFVELMFIVAPESDPIMTTNASVPLFAGNIITLKCEVIGGLPLANISWQCDGSYDQQNNTTKLKIESVVKLMLDMTHNKSCACVASHLGWPSTKKTYIFLDVFYAPNGDLTIQQIPTGGIISGNDVTLTCRASGGNPLATLSWNCTGITNIVTDGTSVSTNLKLKVNESDNNKVCLCSAVHPVLTFKPIAQTELLVYFQPKNDPTMQQTPNGGIIARKKVKLTCSVLGGNPLPALNWNCTGTKTNNNTANTASSSIEFVVNKTQDNTICGCSAMQALTSYSPTVAHRLVVFYAPDNPPEIRQTPSGGIHAGDKVRLTCTVSGGNPLAILTWDCNDNSVNNTSNDMAEYSIDLTVDKSDNNRSCSCKASHLDSTYKPVARHKLIVYYAPDTNLSITQKPIGGILNGNTVTLTCTVSGGNPLATLTWSCNGTKETHTSGTTVLYSIKLLVDKSYNNKMCTCTGQHVIPTYQPILNHNMVVFFKPFLDQTKPYSPHYVSAAKNSSFHLQLTINANPTPTIEWKFRTEADFDSCNFITIVSNTTTNSLLTSSSILIDDVQSDIFGEYTFAANNTVGTFFRRFIVMKEAYLTQVKCPITNENTGMFVAGIVTLVVGLMSLSAAVIFVARNGLQNKAVNSSKSVEYSDVQRRNPAFTDVYTTLQSNIESTVNTEQIINNYEECGRTPEAHTYSSVDKKESELSQYQQHGVNTYEECGKSIDAHAYDTLDK